MEAIVVAFDGGQGTRRVRVDDADGRDVTVPAAWQRLFTNLASSPILTRAPGRP